MTMKFETAPVKLTSQKLRSSTERACLVEWSHVLLAKTEIGNLDVTLTVEQQVVELNVTVDDVVLVEEIQSKDHTGGVEASADLIKDVVVDVTH